MAESDQHRDLVKEMLHNLDKQFPDMSISVDIPIVPGEGAVPPLIGGFRPDIHGYCRATNTHAICEAKTHRDLLSDHTIDQLNAFVTYLANKSRNLLILGVYGIQSAEKARDILQLRYAHFKTCLLHVYDGLDFWEFRHEGGHAWHLL